MECYRASCRRGFWQTFVRSWLIEGQGRYLLRGSSEAPVWNRWVNERCALLLKHIACTSCTWFNSRLLEDILPYCMFQLGVHPVRVQQFELQTHHTYRTFAHLIKALLRDSFICPFWSQTLGAVKRLLVTCPQLVINSNREEKQTAQDTPRRHIIFYLHPSRPHQPCNQPRSREWCTPTPFSRQNFAWTFYEPQGHSEHCPPLAWAMGGCVGKQHVGASNQENDSETEAILDTSNDAMKNDPCTFVDVLCHGKK